jgi:hypothetical protein
VRCIWRWVVNTVLALIESAPRRHAACKEREAFVDAAIARLKEQSRAIALELEILRREEADDGPHEPHPLA